MSYCNSTDEIKVIQPDIPEYPISIPCCDTCVDYTFNEVLLVSRLVHSEAIPIPEDRRHVATVTVNRTESHYYPSTLDSVIHQHRQFDGVKTNRFEKFTIEDLHASFDVLVFKNKSLPDNVLFYFNPLTATNYAFVQDMENKHSHVHTQKGPVKIWQHKYFAKR
jgi:spore germination cell wall hydrolase CwlJ-like protein